MCNCSFPQSLASVQLLLSLTMSTICRQGDIGKRVSSEDLFLPFLAMEFLEIVRQSLIKLGRSGEAERPRGTVAPVSIRDGEGTILSRIPGFMAWEKLHSFPRENNLWVIIPVCFSVAVMNSMTKTKTWVRKDYFPPTRRSQSTTEGSQNRNSGQQPGC